jgi:hypothetical protein
MAKKPALTPDEKFALKFLKDLQKKGKPGQVQERLDRMDRGSKDILASAIKKTKKPMNPKNRAKQASPQAIKVRGRTTGKLNTINIDPAPRRGGKLGGMLGGSGLGRANK